jgi:hypothetical protein
VPAPQYFILFPSFKSYSLQVWNHLFFFFFSPAARPQKQSAMQNQTAVALIKPGNLISRHFQIWLAPD